jgi:hypothetical protein
MSNFGESVASGRFHLCPSIVNHAFNNDNVGQRSIVVVRNHKWAPRDVTEYKPIKLKGDLPWKRSKR